MIRKQEATGKTVDEARAKACALLGVQADDLNVSYEVLEMPQKTGFLGLKTTPAKVRVSVEEPDAPAAPVVEEKVEPEVKPVVEEAPLRNPRPRNLPLPLWQRRPLLLRRLLTPPQRVRSRKFPSTSKRTPRSRLLWTT